MEMVGEWGNLYNGLYLEARPQKLKGYLFQTAGKGILLSSFNDRAFLNKVEGKLKGSHFLWEAHPTDLQGVH